MGRCKSNRSQGKDQEFQLDAPIRYWMEIVIGYMQESKAGDVKLALYLKPWHWLRSPGGISVDWEENKTKDWALSISNFGSGLKRRNKGDRGGVGQRGRRQTKEGWYLESQVKKVFPGDGIGLRQVLLMLRLHENWTLTTGVSNGRSIVTWQRQFWALPDCSGFNRTEEEVNLKQ